MTFTNTQMYDLTTSISENTVIFPGDPKYSMHQICTLDKGDLFNLCNVNFGNHSGTHIDYPAHVLSNGKTSTDYPITSLLGAGIIIDVPETEQSIKKNFIKTQPIQDNDIVFFKTANSKLSKHELFTEHYVYIDPEAAGELLRKKVKIVGIDYISVDKYSEDELPVHNKLLSNDILIVENLELKDCPTGRCNIFIMPLKIDDMDGLPARVIALF